MNQVEIKLDFDVRNYRPGAKIRGQVVYQLDQPLDRLELSLFWATSGKGTVDTEVVRHARLAASGTSGSVPFSLTAPDEPISFSGNLITLSWSLEALAEPGALVDHQDIVIGPGAEELRLPAPVQDDA